MLDRKMIAALGGWEGYRVQRIVWPSDGSRTVTIHLVPTARSCCRWPSSQQGVLSL